MSDTQPKVSITMLSYNHERYIEQAIDGVLMQEVDFPYELIIADDHSPDDTRALILRYKELYPDKIRLLFQPENVGVSKNALMAREMCQGEYKAFCEGDDYWIDPFKLQKQIDFLDSHPEFVGVCHEMKVVDAYGRPKRGFWTNMYCTEEIFDLSEIERMKMPGQTATRVFRNIFLDIDPEILEKYDECPVVADRKLSLLLALNGDVYCMDDTMSCYRWVTTGGTSFNANAGKKIRFDTFCERVNVLSDFAKEAYGVDLDYTNYLKIGMMEIFLRAVRHPKPINIKTFFRAMSIVRPKGQIIGYLCRRSVPFGAKKIKQKSKKFLTRFKPFNTFILKKNSLEGEAPHHCLLVMSELLTMDACALMANDGAIEIISDDAGLLSVPEFLVNEEAFEYEVTRLKAAYSEAPYFDENFPALKRAIQKTLQQADGQNALIAFYKAFFEELELEFPTVTETSLESLPWVIGRSLSNGEELIVPKSSFGSIQNEVNTICSDLDARSERFEAAKDELGEDGCTEPKSVSQNVFIYSLKNTPTSNTSENGWDHIVDNILNHSKGTFVSMLTKTQLTSLPDAEQKDVVVVVGAGKGQLALIERLQQRGLEVLAISVEGPYPGFDVADYFAYADVRDREAVLRATEGYNVKAVMTDQLDIAVPTVAYVAEKTGVPGIGTKCAMNFTNKFIMKRLAEKLNVQVPPYAVVEKLTTAFEVAEKFGYPVVIKPVDSDASRGVFKVHSKDEMTSLFEEAKSYSTNGDVMVEKFIQGIEYCVEGFAYKKGYYNLCIGRRDYFDLDGLFIPKATHFVDAQSARNDVERRILSLNQHLVTGMGLPFGLTHAEYLYDPDTDEIFLEEVAARGGGVGISSDLIPLSCGVDALDLAIDAALGLEIDPDKFTTKKGAAAYHCFALPEGIVESIEGVSESVELDGVRSIDITSIHVGDKIDPMKDKSSRKGPILVYGETEDACNEVFEQVKQKLNIQVETDAGQKGIQW